MEQRLLAAIMGAVTAYIQQEQGGRATSGIGKNAWRLLGQRAQMSARTNARQANPLPGSGVWRYRGLEKLMVTRVRRELRKKAGEDFIAE